MSSDKSGASGLAGRYASALFDLAEADKQLDAVIGNLDSLNAMIGESEDLRRLLSSPVISRDDQSKTLSTIADKAGFNALTVNFIAFGADNLRLSVLPAIINAVKEILSAHRGEAPAEVVSSCERSDKQIDVLVVSP